MIKLLHELTNEEIGLNKALNKAKIIAYKLKNDVFQKWLENELSGYSTIKELPRYRIVPCKIKVQINYVRGDSRTFPMDATGYPKHIQDLLYNAHVSDSIFTVENNIEMAKKANRLSIFRIFPAQMVKLLMDNSNVDTKSIPIEDAGQEIAISNFHNIINRTKQKLIDTLLELNDTFPDFENSFENSTQNEEKASHIVNTYIIGNNNPVNVGVGDNIQQSATVTNEVINNSFKELEKAGVEKSDISDLKTIIESKDTNKTTFAQKSLKWLGDIATSAAKKGIELKMPNILSQLQYITEALTQ